MMTERGAGRLRLIYQPRTIRRLAIVVTTASALVTAALGGLTYWFVHEEIERQIDHRIEIETRTLLAYERQYGFEALLDAIRLRDQLADPGDAGYLGMVDGDVQRAMGYLVVDANGRRLAGGLDAKMPPLGWSEFVHFRRPDGTKAIAQAINSRLPNGSQLLVAADRTAVDHVDAILLRLFAVAFGLLLLVSAGTTLAFGAVIRRRLEAMGTRASAIMAGDMSQRMPVDGSADELDKLAQILNQMLNRIAVLVANLREVSNGLAHDLRTPLSRVQGKLEKASRLATDPVQRELLEAAGDETDELIKLFVGLLSIAEIDGRLIRKRFVQVDLGAAVEEIAEAHRPALEDAGIGLTVIMQPATVLGDKPLLRRIVANLLNNVLIHTPAGTSVQTSLENDGAEAVLRVADDGPGVPAEYRTRVFERLIRLDGSRSKPGHGLGLSIVEAIVLAHGGSVRIVPASVGLTVEVRLPAQEVG